MAKQKIIILKNAKPKTPITKRKFIKKIRDKDGDFISRIFKFEINEALLKQCGITKKIDFYLNFENAEFQNDVNFRNGHPLVNLPKQSKFSIDEFGSVNFHNATFSRDVNFYNATFSGDAYFKNANFLCEANFSYAEFKEASYFLNAKFLKHTDFRDAKFLGEGDFRNVEFSGDANFYNATFSGDAKFSDSSFSKEADFEEATFSKFAYFKNTKFLGDAKFNITKFFTEANFCKADFSEKAIFYNAEFSENVEFSESIFQGRASFENITFKKGAKFWRTIFEKEVDFWAANFLGKKKGKVEFKETIFSDNHTNFFHKLNENEISTPPEIIFQTIIFSNKFILSESDLSKTRFEGCIIEKLQFLNCEFKKEDQFPFRRDAFCFESTQKEHWVHKIFRQLKIFLFGSKRNFKDREQLSRQMKTSLEASKNWNQAGDFFIEEMEARRKQLPPLIFAAAFFIWIYFSAAFLENLEDLDLENLDIMMQVFILVVILLIILSFLYVILGIPNIFYQTLQSCSLFLYKWLFGYAERISVIILWMLIIFVATAYYYVFKEADFWCLAFKKAAFLTILPLTFKAEIGPNVAGSGLKAIPLVISWVYWIMLGVAIRRKFRR